ncbi:auxin efflux carrier transmembrane protein [Ceratobasidium sp. AG-Ba]|nr:auxin efflux carrier transmembrane protein [Ceratobasidium sp. AG-Ba]
MAGELNSILKTALGSAEASIAVLLVLFFGYWAQHIGWVDSEGEKQISHLCITVFLPALLFTQIGPHATISNLTDYGIIIILSIFAMGVSYLVGLLVRRILKGPRWTTAAFIFHNATSLPLLLINSLEKTGTIRTIIGKHGGSVSDAVTRGRTYLLIAALVSNIFRFALGPEIMSHNNSSDRDTNGDVEERHNHTERTPLLSSERVHDDAHQVWPVVKKTGKHAWSWIAGILNPPLIAAIVAVLFGITPPLRHSFFDKGKVLNATITQSIDYLGKLYTALQIFVLGSKLRSKPGAKFPVAPAIALFFHRFFLMPAIMISVVYALRARWPNYIERDPMLDFVLSIVGIGPPAITLAAISEMAELDEQEDGQVARILTIAYVITPLICVPLSATVYAVQQSGVANH